MAGSSSQFNDGLEEAFEKGRFPEVRAYLNKHKGDWENISLRIGVIGEAGAGKSSLINAIFDLKSDSPYYAKTGQVQTTLKEQVIKDNCAPGLELVDLPGVGTPKFPRKSYMKDINFSTFDFFLIVSAGRFRENDFWLLDEAKKLRKTPNMYFVRTKVDHDLEGWILSNNGLEGTENEHSEKNFQECLEALKGEFQAHEKNCTCKLFFISSPQPEKYKLKDLKETIVKELPENKRAAVEMRMTATSKKMIDEKVKIMQKNIWKCGAVSLLGHLGGACLSYTWLLPIGPAVTVGVDIGVIIWQVRTFHCQLGLDLESLQILAKSLGMDRERLLETVMKYNLGGLMTVGGLIPFIEALKRQPAFQQIVDKCATTAAASTTFMQRVLHVFMVNLGHSIRGAAVLALLQVLLKILTLVAQKVMYLALDGFFNPTDPSHIADSSRSTGSSPGREEMLSMDSSNVSFVLPEGLFNPALQSIVVSAIQCLVMGRQ